MRESQLPSPGIGGKGYHLRRIASLAISRLQVQSGNRAGGKHPDATTLRAFFSACADALIPIDPTPAAENDSAVVKTK